VWAVKDLQRTLSKLEDLGAHVFETSNDDARDAIDLEGTVFRAT
jgi:hypothetical protein